MTVNNQNLPMVNPKKTKRALMRSAEAAAIAHTHSNKTLLDSISQSDFDNLNANTAYIASHQLHGVISGMEISLNANPRYFNVASGVYYINGIRKEFNGALVDTVSITSGFGSALIDANGNITLKDNDFPDTEDENDGKLELTAFLKTDANTIPVGGIGPSFFNSLNFIKKIYIRHKYFEGTIFSLSAGLISENTTNSLQLDIGGGKINNPVSDTATIVGTTNIVGRKTYHVSGVYETQPTSTIVVDVLQYDNGIDLANIPNNKYTTHTIARSSRTGIIYFVYGTLVYNKLTEAIAAPTNIGPFAGNIGSQVEPIANIVVDQGAGTIAEIIDVRNNSNKLTSSINPQDLGWKDNIIPFGIAGKGSSAPSEVNDSNGWRRLSFGEGDEVFVDFHVNHDYARGTDAYPHIHWMPTTTMSVGQTVIWELEYVIARGHQQGDSLLTTPITMTLTHTADGTEVAGEHMVTECSDIDAFDLIEPDTVISMKVTRGNGTYNSAVYGIMADLHYQADRDSTLNKAPDFYS